MDAEAKARADEFLALLKSSGFEAAEAARRIGFDRANISQYKKGTTAPDAQTLKLFKRIVLEENPSALQPITKYPEHHERIVVPDVPEVAAAADQLREMYSEDRAAFHTVNSVIKTFYAKQRRANSKTVESGRNVVRRAASKVKHAAAPKSPPSPRADEHSAGT